MDQSNRKRRGFIKEKLSPFYRAAKSVPTTKLQVKPNLQGSTTTGPFSYRVQYQDYMNVSQPKPVSFIVPAADKNRENLSQIDNFFGVAGDEGVDLKAATYITSVQERFKLERNNSERIQLPEIAH